MELNRIAEWLRNTNITYQSLSKIEISMWLSFFFFVYKLIKNNINRSNRHVQKCKLKKDIV